MIAEYFLMHKKCQCGIILLDSVSGHLLRFKPLIPEHTPFLGNSTDDLMKKWWQSRAIPGARKDLHDILRNVGCETNLEYMAKNLALSMTDTYWICPTDLQLSWEQVNLYTRSFKSGIVTLHNISSYDPNATLGGQMDKYWDTSGPVPVLVKTAYRDYGQQSLNEEFAALVHSRQPNAIPYVSYKTERSSDQGVSAKCEAFTRDDLEFISAYECINSEKHRKNDSLYEKYIDICTRHGIDSVTIRNYMDYQTLTDFVLSNTDEHLMNFGILRNPDTLEFVAPAPLFDSGNSMFYNEFSEHPYSAYQLLCRKVTGLYEYEERYLPHVKNSCIIDFDSLPSPEETRSFFTERSIPEKKAEFIAASYKVKLELLQRFQSGHKIKMYLEKRNEK